MLKSHNLAKFCSKICKEKEKTMFYKSFYSHFILVTLSGNPPQFMFHILENFVVKITLGRRSTLIAVNLERIRMNQTRVNFFHLH